MSTDLIVVLVAVPTYAVVLSLFFVMWLESRSSPEKRVGQALSQMRRRSKERTTPSAIQQR
jgi:hypothetical protein